MIFPFLAFTLTLDRSPSVAPAFATSAVPHDADDPAIWVNRRNPAGSLILGTDKTEKNGGLYVFDLQGRIRQRIGKLDRPNNVDVEYGLRLGSRTVDVAVVTERKQRRLRIFEIGHSGVLTDISGDTAVFQGETGDAAEPMGIGLYRRFDGSIYAIVSPKSGPRDAYLGQYELRARPDGKVDVFPIRRFGAYSGKKEIESIFVDDLRRTVYYSDETVGNRKYSAEPDAANVSQGFFNTAGVRGDHEGIALWASANGNGYLVFTDQRKGSSLYRVHDRQGSNLFRGAFFGGADDTDGIEITSAPLGPRFPEGIMVGMNSKGRNFLVWDWRDVRRALGL